MGQLVNGVWKDEWYDTEASGGEFVRDSAKHRNWVTADGSPGPRAGGITCMCPMPAPGRIGR